MGAVVNTAGVRAGSSVVVIGCGGVGLNSIQGARIAGASRSSPSTSRPPSSPPRANSARRETINARSEDVAERVTALTGGTQSRLGVRHRRRQGRGRTGRFADEAQRRDRARRHAAVRGHGDDRSRLARRRRPEDSRLEDGLGAASDRRAEDRRSSIARGASSSTN